MKNFTTVKKTIFKTTLIACVFLLVSCDNTKKVDDSKEVAEELNEEKFDNTKQENDAQFLVNASECNLKEIQLGKLAQQKGNSAHIKQLGKMMEDAHTKSQNELTALAESKGITIPIILTEDANNAYTDLNKKSGNDFDKAYADKMVDTHEDAIEDFEEHTMNSNDADIKNWAIATLPVLRTHLNHAITSRDKLKAY